MKTEKRIWLAMVYKTVLDRFLEDSYRQQRTTSEALQAWQGATVMEYAEADYDVFFPPDSESQEGAAQTFGGDRYGVPVLNAPSAPQQEYVPQQGAQPIQGELPRQGATAPPTLWASSDNDHIPPAKIEGMGKWGGWVPFKSDKSQCKALGRPWKTVTYFDILDHVNVALDEPGKPTYDSDWSTLSWLISSADLTHEKYGKGNRYKVGQLKAVMLEIARRRPAAIPKKREPSQGRYVPDAEETDEFLNEPTPF